MHRIQVCNGPHARCISAYTRHLFYMICHLCVRMPRNSQLIRLLSKHSNVLQRVRSQIACCTQLWWVEQRGIHWQLTFVTLGFHTSEQESRNRCKTAFPSAIFLDAVLSFDSQGQGCCQGCNCTPCRFIGKVLEALPFSHCEFALTMRIGERPNSQQNSLLSLWEVVMNKILLSFMPPCWYATYVEGRRLRFLCVHESTLLLPTVHLVSMSRS